MISDLNDLKKLSQTELKKFFHKLLVELGVESFIALDSLPDKTLATVFLNTVNLGKDNKSQQGASLLHFAAAAGLTSAVFAFLNLGYPNEITKIGANIGHYAAQAGHIKTIQALIHKNVIDLNAKDNHGAGLILYAAYGGQVETLTILIAMGLEKNELNNNGAGVLFYAVQGASLSVIEALMELDYNPYVLDKFGNSLLHYAARCGKPKLITFFIENYDLDPNEKNGSQKSILDLASESGCKLTIALCKSLIAQ